jgi:cupin fold WbuC family metalloprotein
MAVGLQPCTYVPPHRHLSADKAETLLVLKGRLGVLIFDETGAVVDKCILQAGGDCLGVDLPAGIYHGLVVLEADSLMFECKAGPYRPVGEGELAHWAPREGEAGVAQYHAWMRAQFD